MKADEFDERFDRGADITSELDLTAARRPGYEQRRVNLDSAPCSLDAIHSPTSHSPRI